MLLNIITISIVVITAIVLYFSLNKRLKQLSGDADSQALTMLNQNVHGMQERIDRVNDTLSTRLDNAAKVIAEVSRNLGQMQEIGHGMKDLQNFLRSPKLRGNLGEQILQDILRQNFPQSFFEMQYKFKSGEIVDALLKTEHGFIGIDSKFPLENFSHMLQAANEAEQATYTKLFARDVKKHISAITKKYILPEEGTVNFAIMYIPSETVYYEVIRHAEDLNAFANENKVLLVSPNSFYYFLKVIMMGMQGKKIEEQAKTILVTFESIAKDARKFNDSLGVLNTHITNAKGALDRVNNDYTKLSAKIDQVTLLK